ncbi:hypothetical protein Sme01_04190 [Sphaerisporangium melleum]|uniref:Uncharacterized protein n=1 Tax=Sphaerisporangium melleum TaxID=321316 RepID=A0A917QQL5_9ACTN|nr:hypothetical protein [Sphaerisporangium melleum]GGK62219.1 hypothetical protein GCM10007964_01740 [Sphaerisporangium melleum]GII67943.1 hypothetical protein Sme01_04190 [Sphaerisporangium melleum]
MSLTHEPYIAAVLAALTAIDLEPTRWWVSDAEIDPRGDGCTTMDDAVLIWDDQSAVNIDEHPHGVLVSWESSADAWRWARLRSDGSNELLEALDLPLDAAPEHVVETLRTVLSGHAAGGEGQ